MRITTEGNFLKISMTDVIESLQGQDRIDLIERLACETDIALAVADLIVDGYTANGSSAWKATHRLRSVPQTGIEAIRMYIADNYCAIAGKEFENVKTNEQKLAKELEEWKEKYNRINDELRRQKDEAERIDRNKTLRLKRMANETQDVIDWFLSLADTYILDKNTVLTELRKIKGHE